MLKNKNYLYLGIALLFIFVLFSVFVVTNKLYTLDYSALYFSQAVIPQFLITPFSLLSVLGSFEITLILFVLLLFLLKGVNKLGVFILFGFVTLIEVAGKNYIAQIPPPSQLLLTNLHLGFPSGGVSGELFAYPSGHMARTSFISGFLILMIILNSSLKNSTKYLLISGILIFDLVMFLSRFYLAEHWMSDVIGGALLGFSFAFFTAYFVKKTSVKD